MMIRVVIIVKMVDPAGEGEQHSYSTSKII